MIPGFENAFKNPNFSIQNRPIHKLGRYNKNANVRIYRLAYRLFQVINIVTSIVLHVDSIIEAVHSF